MYAPRSFRIVDTSLGFIFVLLVCFFGIAEIWPKEGLTHLSALAWAAVSSLSCYFVLDSLNYFETFKPLPSRANFFTLLVALPWGPLVFNFLVGAIVDHGIIRHRTIYFATPLVALFVLYYQYVAGLVFISSKNTKKLWCILNEKDRAELQKELEQLKLAPYFEWISSPEKIKPDLIIISRMGTKNFSDNQGLLQAHLKAIPIMDIRTMLTELRGKVSVENTDLWLYLQTATKQSGLSRTYFQLKMFFEPAIGVLLGILLLPIFLFVSVLVKITSRGPIIYSQTRTGHRGKTFELYKFRTMKVQDAAAPVAWAKNETARITPIGSFLRNSHLDEIPQLWNILKGELSFVGPRPERPEFYEILKAPIPLFFLRTMVRPGITGWAQIMGGYAGSVEESKQKLEHDLYYMQHLSLRMDFVILIKTFLLFFSFKDPKAS